MIKKTAIFTIAIISIIALTQPVKSNKPLKNIEGKYINNINNKNSPMPKPTIKTPPEPDITGKTSYVPWEKDVRFLELQKKNDVLVQMCAYKTVLKDPLPGEEFNVHLAASKLAGTIVQPGEIFSQNKTIGPYSRANGFKSGPTYKGVTVTKTTGGGVCKIASTLYNVAVLSNLEIIERYNHSMPVPYVPYGQDATVSYGALDFKFINNTSFPILIWAQGIDNTLYMAFYGKVKAPNIEWHHKFIKVYTTDVIYQDDPSMKKGEEKIVSEGMDGGIVESWVTIENQDGKVTKKKLRKSYYRPLPYIINRGQ